MKTRILIVDDHPTIRFGLSQLLAAEPDLEVVGEAGDRRTALEILDRTRPDLVILDISLNEAEATGLDLIGDIHRRAGRLPVLVLSMHSEMIFAERALKAGASGYLMKQEPVRTVIEAVRRILGGGVYLSPAMQHVSAERFCGRAPTRPGGRPVEALSEREFEVFRLIGRGMKPREVAAALFLSPKTVETHRRSINKKLGLAGASELARFAVEWVSREI